ncbi:alpha/beta hydrolase [Thalassotalea ponticola]|uniref:alpha/beta family hydrolase n=1 Tax=Thalassotalea ponticola TaxID=1523392 RepID=UPI0025B3FB64|nr:alpha/beta family hydrolase [Thalassotalea ponticola]MDN3651555.1 alpha/beta hydrolase [Thalassotalea ponticola]
MKFEDDLQWQVDLAEQPIASIILAHGAGADMDSPFMQTISRGLVANGINVYRFNFPYMQQRLIDGKRRPPNKMDVLIDSFIHRVARYDHSLPLFIGGKSMGSRVAATISARDKVCAVIALGYPFHPQKKPEKTRLEPLQATSKPVLILQGTRDPLGTQEEIASYGLGEHIEVRFFDDGDHDLKPRVRSGFTHQQHLQDAVAQIRTFIQERV